MGNYTVHTRTKPLAFGTVTLGTAQNLPNRALAYGARLAVIRVEGAAARWRDDGTDPTATVGMPLNVGEELHYDGDMNAIKFIQQAATSTLFVTFYAT